jgi:hypothetical protein
MVDCEDVAQEPGDLSAAGGCRGEFSVLLCRCAMVWVAGDLGEQGCRSVGRDWLFGWHLLWASLGTVCCSPRGIVSP